MIVRGLFAVLAVIGFISPAKAQPAAVWSGRSWYASFGWDKPAGGELFVWQGASAQPGPSSPSLTGVPAPNACVALWAQGRFESGCGDATVREDLGPAGAHVLATIPSRACRTVRGVDQCVPSSISIDMVLTPSGAPVPFADISGSTFSLDVVYVGGGAYVHQPAIGTGQVASTTIRLTGPTETASISYGTGLGFWYCDICY